MHQQTILALTNYTPPGRVFALVVGERETFNRLVFARFTPLMGVPFGVAVNRWTDAPWEDPTWLCLCLETPCAAAIATPEPACVQVAFESPGEWTQVSCGSMYCTFQNISWTKLLLSQEKYIHIYIYTFTIVLYIYLSRYLLQYHDDHKSRFGWYGQRCSWDYIMLMTKTLSSWCSGRTLYTAWMTTPRHETQKKYTSWRNYVNIVLELLLSAAASTGLGQASSDGPLLTGKYSFMIVTFFFRSEGLALPRLPARSRSLPQGEGTAVRATPRPIKSLWHWLGRRRRRSGVRDGGTRRSQRSEVPRWGRGAGRSGPVPRDLWFKRINAKQVHTSFSSYVSTW